MRPHSGVSTGRSCRPSRRRQAHGDAGDRCSPVVAHGGGHRRAGTAGRAATGQGDARGPPTSVALGRPVAAAALGDRGLPAPVTAAGAGSAGRWGAGGAGAAQADGRLAPWGTDPGKSDPIDALAVARAALREPELPWPTWMGWSARCGCWWIIARTWWPSGPGPSSGCAGTCTSWSRAGRSPRAGWTGRSGWTRSPPAWAPIRGWWLRSLGSWWVAAAS